MFPSASFCRARLRALLPIAAIAHGALLGCVSEPDRAARLPNVATRHAPVAIPSASAAPPAARATSRLNDGDPAQAFEPPAHLRLPGNLQAGERVPLLMVLHGFGVSSDLLIAKAGLNAIADQKKFAYLAPEGSRDSLGRPFWNAGKSCCDLDHRAIDDVKRLRELLDANLGNASIDPQRVFVIGYSNGGFMAQRLACDMGGRIAGVVSVAGAAPSAGVPCTQNSALAVLEIHGDADPIVHYTGGTVFDRTDVEAHGSALDTVKFWANHLACNGTPRTVNSIDLEPYVPERETTVQRYDDCHGTVELWTVKGGGHYVALQPPALDAIWSFIQAHPKGGA
ncbi:MAG TPA: PHB depolymerase family esterase [Polyangiaceae bacterium]